MCKLSGQIRDRDWKRVIPIESSRGQSLCEVDAFKFKTENILPK